FGIVVGQQTHGNGVDILDTGLVVSGPVTFERKDDNVKFTITDPTGRIAPIIPVARHESLSNNRSQPWVRARVSYIRIAAIRNKTPAAAVTPETTKHVGLCTPPKLQAPAGSFISFSLRCASFDGTKWYIYDNESIEVAIVITVPNGSTTETFLNGNR